MATAIVAACLFHELCASLQNCQGLADIHLASLPASASSGFSGNIVATGDSNAASLVHNANWVSKWVDKQVPNDVNYNKLITESPGLNQQTLSAFTKASHNLNRTVLCHASDLNSYKQAVFAGVDRIHHVKQPDVFSHLVASF